ncbi:hypothetical protein SSYRP_v1c05810 [Spiroplasma syrphidicola EA-1]|uniref:Uncharacterized protein n=1 Tax=Spiroplasma syrphidicola EA-1 TaxID=1276229 RepID=R4ULT6_9MOLU|nr:hypothetical protein [Spiroplasma syrphidicola]AGM26171.1 hypothetical protein SSYRP_v1c05810 [Spiroplasma syrphidicola EA-1]
MSTKQNEMEIQKLINKYFDEVITSSGIDATKRPDVALQWAKEKELWSKEQDAELQRQLLLQLEQAKLAGTNQSLIKKHLKLKDLQQIRLQELKLREEYLATLNQKQKLPRITKKDLNADVKINQDSEQLNQEIMALKKKKAVDDQSYGTMFMQQIAKTLIDEYEMYNQPPVVKLPKVKKVKKPRKLFTKKIVYKKGPRSKW